MSATKIPWATDSWNPVTGCTKISPGCQNCYAERMAKRLKGRHGYPEDEPFRPTEHPDRIDQPGKWARPRDAIFVCSMGDLFHTSISSEFQEAVWGTMEALSRHRYLVLTKRPGQAIDDLAWIRDRRTASQPWPLPNVLIGVTVEDPQHAFRIDALRKIPAAGRFVSAEPLLGPLEITDRLRGPGSPDWLIAGCEKGQRRRRAREPWFASLRDQARMTGTAFFLKQMEVDGEVREMPPLDGRRWTQVPWTDRGNRFQPPWGDIAGEGMDG